MAEEHRIAAGERAVEGADIHPRRVLAGAGAIAATVVAVVLLVRGLLSLWDLPVHLGSGAPLDFRTDKPRLEPAPQTARAAYFAEMAQRLHSYGWVDRAAGTAHIPIETAMMLLAAREKAAREAAAVAPAGKTEADKPSDRKPADRNPADRKPAGRRPPRPKRSARR